MGAIDYRRKIDSVLMNFGSYKINLFRALEETSFFQKVIEEVRCGISPCDLSEGDIRNLLIKDFISHSFTLDSHDSFNDFKRKMKIAITECPEAYDSSLDIFKSHLRLIVEANQFHGQCDKILGFTSSDNSLMKCIGEKYPDNTCPMIDSVIDDIKSDINRLENDIVDCERRYEGLENELGDLEIDSPEYNEFIEDNEMNQLYASIEEKREEIEELEGYIYEGEKLRSACESAREDLSSMSDDVKESIELYMLDDIVICEINPSESTVDYFMKDESKNTPMDYKDLYSEAMNNHSEFFRLAEILEELSKDKDKIEKLLCENAHYVSIDDYIDDFLSR